MAFKGSEQLPEALENALSLYRGSFLAEESEEAWAIRTRERLRGRYIHALVCLGSYLESAERYDEAVEWYMKGLDADPIVETFYQGLMRCYDRLDRRTEAISAYRRLRQTLSVTLGLKPSSATEKLYRTIAVD